ncbi:hypothetical protein ABEF95_008264 [Exophiala dermatitidis]
MPTTLVTGANGFVGAAVVNELITQHHKVILAVRTPSSAEGLVSKHPEWPAQDISVARVADFTVPGVFDEVFHQHPDIEYIVHVAAPLLDDPHNTDFVEHFEKPSVLGNTGLLTSALRYGNKVKAISVTGSINAITLGDQDDVKKRAFDNKDWLPLGREDAINAQDPYISYCVGKKLAEQAIWKFIDEQKPPFSVTNFMPPLIFGPMFQKVPSVAKINFSNRQFHSILNSAKAEGRKVPSTMFPGYIDVRDLAKIQVSALTTPGAANKRFVVGHPMLFNSFADALRDDPELHLASRIGENNDEESTLTLPRFETKEAEGVFRFKWTSLEKTARDTAIALLEVEALDA